MRRSLIAIAIAGSLATGVAGAQGMTLHTVDHDRIVAPTHVQYYERSPVYERGPVYQRVRSTPAIDEREARLQERLERGTQSGRLTRQEQWRLHRQLENIQVKERDFMADGRLTRWEERELMRDLDRVAANMRTQLRDEQRY